MDLGRIAVSDAAILFFGLAGLVATAVAIFVDTKDQAAEVAGEPLRPVRME